MPNYPTGFKPSANKSAYPGAQFENELLRQMDSSYEEWIILSPEQLRSVLDDKLAEPANHSLRADYQQSTFFKNVSNLWTRSVHPFLERPSTLPAAQLGLDFLGISKTLKALGGWNARYTVHTVGGTQYIHLRGDRNLREMLRGTRYLATNPKVVQLGVGVRGLKSVASGGFVLGMVLSVGVEVLDFIFRESKTWVDLVAGVGVEAVKGALSGAVGYLAGALAAGLAGTTTLAVLPLAVMALAAFAVGWGLNELDDEYKIKVIVAKALNSLPENVTAGLYEISNSALDQLTAVRNQVVGSALRAVAAESGKPSASLDQQLVNILMRLGRR
jgi:hypothetical protein